jgi:hypothetical protein
MCSTEALTPLQKFKRSAVQGPVVAKAAVGNIKTAKMIQESTYLTSTQAKARLWYPGQSTTVVPRPKHDCGSYAVWHSSSQSVTSLKGLQLFVTGDKCGGGLLP